jgi:TadE-like protein
MRKKKGQATLEFALVYVSIMAPVTFAIIFTAQLLWVWHSAIEMTREGARYAATHCWQADGNNVLNYIRQNVPVNVDQDQFALGGTANISVAYFTRDANSGTLVDFTCDGDCSPACVPDAVTISITGYEYRRFLAYLGIAPIALPDFTTTLAMEGAGCDPEQGSCTP